MARTVIGLARLTTSMLPLATVIVALVTVVSSLEAQPASGPVYDSYRRAYALVTRALEAHGGGSAIRGLSGIEFGYRGFTYDRDQTVRPDAAFEASPPRRPMTVAAAVDFRTGIRRQDLGTNARIVQRGREIIRYALPGPDVERTFTRDSVANDGSTSFPFQHQLMPVLVLRQAIVRSSSLRHIGIRSNGGVSEEIVSFNNADGSVLAIGIDAKTGLLNTVETIGEIALFGDGDHVWRFAEYERTGGVMVPRSFQHRINGLLQEEMRLAHIAVNPTWSDTSFAPPSDYALRPSVVAPSRPVSVADSGGGVYFVEGLGGYRTMFIDLGDGIAVVEAPQSQRIAEQTIAFVERTLPGKRITHLVVTHHHLDHVGGVRAYADRGVTLVVPAGMETFLRRVLSGTRTFGMLGQPSRPVRSPVIESVSDRRQLGPMELIHAATSHTSGMLLVYVPGRRLIFQADLFQIDESSGRPREPLLAGELAGIIERHGLDVETVASVHGRNATIAELRAARLAPASPRR